MGPWWRSQPDWPYLIEADFDEGEDNEGQERIREEDVQVPNEEKD